MLNSQNHLKMSRNSLIFLVSGLVSALISFSSYSQPCPSPSNVLDTSYSWRGTHCEGIKKGEEEQTRNGSFRLVSFSTGKIQKYDNRLHLNIPSSNPKQLRLKIESWFNDYEANWQKVSLPFSLETRILKREKVPPENLRFLAWERLNSNQSIYLPVIHNNNTATTYEIVWYSRYKTNINLFEIRSQSNQTIFSCGEDVSYPANNEISCQWDAQNTPVGKYLMYLDIEQFPYNKDKREFTREITFFHDPQWLKK